MGRHARSLRVSGRSNSPAPAAPAPGRRPRPLLWFLLAACLLALRPGSAAEAQSQFASYWQYPAAGRLQQVVTADLNQDGIEEFLVATQNGRVDLVSSDGFQQWSYEARPPILALSTASLGPAEADQQAVVIGTRQGVTLLDAAGELRWQTPLEPLAPPLSLFTGGGAGAVRSWQATYPVAPVELAPLDANGDGRDEILVLLASGQVQLLDVEGRRLWRYERNNSPLADTSPLLQVVDVGQDGRQDAILGFFIPSRRFSRLVALDGDGAELWSLPVSGRITAMTLLPASGEQPVAVAVGTSLGNVNLYTTAGQRLWPRTVNRPVTTLSPVVLADGDGVAVGTSVGTVVVYDRAGRRAWSNHLAPEADRPVLALSHAPMWREASQAVLAAVVGDAAGGGPADVILLGNDGRRLKTFTDVDERGFTRLLDINRDGHSEILLARFPNLELLGLGIGASETAEEWSEVLRAVPLSYLVVDFDQDGSEELLIGADDGRLHRLNNDGYSQWTLEPGGDIDFLSTLSLASASPTRIVLGRNLLIGNDETLSWLEVRHANGELVWSEPLPARLTSLLVGNLNERGDPEIVVGTELGTVIVFSASGSRLWENQIVGPVRHLRILDETVSGLADRPELIVANNNELFKMQDGSPALNRITFFDQPIVDVQVLQQPGNELATRLLVLVGDGYAYGLNWRGILLPPWPIPLQGVPVRSLPATERLEDVFDLQQARAESFLVATDGGGLVNLQVEDNRPRLVWRISGLDDITSLYWGDVDGDSLQDVAIGTAARQVQVYTQEPRISTLLDLVSNAAAMTVLHRDVEQESDLVVMTENGLVQLYRAQENRPPLLTNPGTNVRQGQYGVSIFVGDVEGDPVRVRLEVQDPETEAWLPQEERQLSNGNGQLIFSVINPPVGNGRVRYRFHYQDPFHQGYVVPTAGPAPLIPSPLARSSGTILGVLAVASLAVTLVLVRQAQSPAARARRFHRRLRRQPELTLTLLEKRIVSSRGAPDFLLYLTSQARQSGDWLVASLTDGLFLLPSRPYAALSILDSALDEIETRQLDWPGWERWQLTCRTGLALLESPSITELGLLQPQLVDLLIRLEDQESWSPTLEILLPILTNLRDSERVELVEDRLVYLNQAATLLEAAADQLPDSAEGIDKILVQAIVPRWAGLVSARIEELRGRAELVVKLKTRRLVPNGRTDVAVEILNSGRAAAEQVVAVLDDRPAYQVHTPPQIIPLIPPGRSRQVRFAIEPRVQDHFRIAMTLTYSDRNQLEKKTAFGDMVHLLAPQRDFRPIVNPYIPGSPLRRDSALFYGRREIFDFIIENVGPTAQRNVLILIGQRRTGKTSALLQLEHHLPPHMYPVYIDCQSLGVSPGLAGLFNELAWLIADTLAARQIEVPLPEVDAWTPDPAGLFQRHFLPQVRSHLPDDATLLLVFDEFESFADLVGDGIIPASFFPFLRHLMQHSRGLGFIFVGTRRLEEMGADYWSVLFNIALYQKIGYLSHESATRLITEPVSPTLIYDDLALDKILRVTAGHPYFLQLVCYTLVKQANTQRTGYVTISDVNAALDEMLRLGEVHFAYLWQRATAAERAVLTAIAHLMDPDVPIHPEAVMDSLAPYGIKLHPAEVTAAFSALVERDIMQEVTEGGTTLYQLQIGLVGLWVAKNKSLSKLLHRSEERRP